MEADASIMGTTEAARTPRLHAIRLVSSLSDGVQRQHESVAMPSTAADAIVLYVGSQDAADNIDGLRAAGITHVLTVASGIELGHRLPNARSMSSSSSHSASCLLLLLANAVVMLWCHRLSIVRCRFWTCPRVIFARCLHDAALSSTKVVAVAEPFWFIGIRLLV